MHLLAESFGRSACPFHHDRRGRRSGRKADGDAAARTAVTVSRARGEVVPFEAASLKALTEDLRNPCCALSFLGDYLRMLPRRMGRIVNHVRDQDGTAP